MTAIIAPPAHYYTGPAEPRHLAHRPKDMPRGLQLPRLVQFAEALPRTPSGKLM